MHTPLGSRENDLTGLGVLRAAVIAALLVAMPAMARQTSDHEGAARGFPVLRDVHGEKLADGDFAQWVENDRLHVRITYQFGRERRIEERAVFRQGPRLVQEQWSWREVRDGTPVRQIDVDFGSGTAAAEKHEPDGVKKWREEIEVEPGRTFAGFGFTLAIKRLRERLIDGEIVELQAVGFTPRPRVVPVDISYGGLDEMRMAGRVLRGDRFVIHPKLPWFAKLFVEVPNVEIWLTHPPPAGFLRWEGPLAEPDDPLIRVDLLPGGESGPPEPVERNTRH